MPVQFQNRRTPLGLHEKMREFHQAGDDIVWVAIRPGPSPGFTIIPESNRIFSQGIPADLGAKLGDLSRNAAKIIHVSFTPDGSGWVTINNQGELATHGIPNDCDQRLNEIRRVNTEKVIFVAFHPDGGWVIITNRGTPYKSGLPSACALKIDERFSAGDKISVVAFPPAGGDRWVIASERGYWTWNADGEAHMYMGFFYQVYGPVKVTAFDPDGTGWTIVCSIIKHEKVCDDTRCVSIEEVYKNVRARLAGHCVGYAVAVGSTSYRSGCYTQGAARTSADPPSQPFLPWTKLDAASVGKVITAIPVVRLLVSPDGTNNQLNTSIGPFFPPDWHVPAHVAAITFRQLLSHRSGIIANPGTSYDALKELFTRTLSPENGNPAYDPAKPSRYNNKNFEIIRILLPKLAGFAEDPANRARKLAEDFVKICQQNVFEPVGVQTAAKAVGNAFTYAYPGTNRGWDSGDMTLTVGGGGWYLSIDDAARILNSLNRRDEKILSRKQFAEMAGESDLDYALGFDVIKDRAGYRWVEKNGGFENGTFCSTTIALFGPGVFGALFINSNVSPIVGTSFEVHWLWCRKCRAIQAVDGANLGGCPAGGTHDHTGSMPYMMQTGDVSSVPGGQRDWRKCKKCKGLVFPGGASRGKCSADGHQHDVSGSVDYTVARRLDMSPLLEEHEENWRQCNKCQVLSYGPQQGDSSCAAGAKHDHAGSSNYMVPMVVAADVILHDAYMKALKPRAP